MSTLWRSSLAAIALALAAGLATGCAGPEAERRRNVEASLRLRISTVKQVYQVGETLEVEARIVNDGAESVPLVQAGDGSYQGWRTPVLRWRVERMVRVHDRAKPGMPPAQPAAPRPIAPVRPEQVVLLRAGREMPLDLLGEAPEFKRHGTFIVRLYYDNRPALRFQSPWRGTHDSDAMSLVRRTDRCLLESNPIEVAVLPAWLLERWRDEDQPAAEPE